MKEYNIKVNFETGEIISSPIYLVQNDYNSTKFNIEFDKDYTNYFKKIVIVFPNNTVYEKEIVNNEFIFVEYNENGEEIALINQQGEYKFNFSLYNENSKITTTYNSYFYANDDISNGEEIELDDRLPILDDLINNVTQALVDTEEATSYANTQGQYAETQGNYAEEQGDYAKQQGQNVQKDISEIRIIAETAEDKSDTAISISKGANQSLPYENYEVMITNFNAFEEKKFNCGQQVMIKTLNVPDLWVYDYASEKVEYEYTNDETIVNSLKEQGHIQVGWYLLAQLETQKVDLTGYVKNTDYATSSKAGVIKIWSSTNEDDELTLNISTED